MLRAPDIPHSLTERTVPPCPQAACVRESRRPAPLSLCPTVALSLWDSSLIDGMHSIEPCFSHSSSFWEVNQVTVPACRPARARDCLSAALPVAEAGWSVKLLPPPCVAPPQLFKRRGAHPRSGVVRRGAGQKSFTNKYSAKATPGGVPMGTVLFGAEV